MRNYTKSVQTYFGKKEEAQKKEIELAKLQANKAIETVQQNRKKYNILNKVAEQRMLANFSVYADNDSQVSSLSPEMVERKVKKSASPNSQSTMSMSKITKAETKYSNIYIEAKQYKQNKLQYLQHKKN